MLPPHRGRLGHLCPRAPAAPGPFPVSSTFTVHMEPVTAPAHSPPVAPGGSPTKRLLSLQGRAGQEAQVATLGRGPVTGIPTHSPDCESLVQGAGCGRERTLQRMKLSGWFNPEYNFLRLQTGGWREG